MAKPGKKQRPKSKWWYLNSLRPVASPGKSLKRANQVAKLKGLGLQRLRELEADYLAYSKIVEAGSKTARFTFSQLARIRAAIHELEKDSE